MAAFRTIHNSIKGKKPGQLCGFLGGKKPKTARKNEYNVPLSHNAIKTT